MDPLSLLERQYRKRFRSHEAYRRGVWRVLCEGFFSRYIPKESAVLDVGSGWGEFINHVSAAEKHAMDLNEDGGRHLASDVRFVRQDCSKTWPFAADSLDVVFTSNFLEHLPDKGSVERLVGEAFRCLRPGGRFICLGPNIRFVGGSYWDFWDHHIPLTEKSCCEVLELSGFQVDECRDRFLPYSMVELRPPFFLLSLFLKFPLAWRLFGKQFLIVARKATCGVAQDCP